ncbi:MAG: ATPase [Candidatus Thorarchaeota archaeon]|nr:ATPase [Candidatus Thorarchaeota archaeon]
MKFDNRITSLVMLLFGVVLLTLAVSLISMTDASTILRALGTPTGPGFVPLQATEGAGIGILGLAIGAGLALGLAGVGAAIGMGTASAAALGAITEKPETFGKSILYVVFIEAVAIYGFVIAFLLVGYIPSLIG